MQGHGGPAGDVEDMKAAIAATLLTLLLAPSAALADSAPATDIVVSGTGSVTLAPDVASVSGSVQTTSANSADAV